MTLSLLRARRTFPDPLALGLDGVPQTITFAPVFDRRVDLDVVTEDLLPGRIEMGARLNFGTGVPYSRPIAGYVGFETDPVAAGGGFGRSANGSSNARLNFPSSARADDARADPPCRGSARGI